MTEKPFEDGMKQKILKPIGTTKVPEEALVNNFDRLNNLIKGGKYTRGEMETILEEAKGKTITDEEYRRLTEYLTFTTKHNRI